VHRTDVEESKYRGRAQRVSMPLDEWQYHRDTSWSHRGRLIAKGRYAYRMWIKYDAIPSHKLGKPDAVLPNGGSYGQSNLNTPGGQRMRRTVIEKWGRDIPFLGWDESSYKEWYKDHSVFSEPVAKKMSYSGSGNKNGSNNSIRKLKARAFGHRITYLFRSLTACRK
jgi:hypothetical protein